MLGRRSFGSLSPFRDGRCSAGLQACASRQNANPSASAKTVGMTLKTNAMYTVPKLEDYSPEALDRAVAELSAALDHETSALHSDAD